jgi:uncharacterized damage-inducible protein DinB
MPGPFLILSERHLHRAMREYQEYFNHARPHQEIEVHHRGEIYLMLGLMGMEAPDV